MAESVSPRISMEQLSLEVQAMWESQGGDSEVEENSEEEKYVGEQEIIKEVEGSREDGDGGAVDRSTL
jgi:hypothetical protein